MGFQDVEHTGRICDRSRDYLLVRDYTPSKIPIVAVRELTMSEQALVLTGADTDVVAPQPESIPQASVQAPREVTITRGDRVGTSSKHMGERVTLSRRVDVSDLDLATADSAPELQARIGGAAQDVCHQLKVLYPNGATDIPGYEYTNDNCVRDAVAGANERLDAAVGEASFGIAD